MSEREKGDYDNSIADFTEAIILNTNSFDDYARRAMRKTWKAIMMCNHGFY